MPMPDHKRRDKVARTLIRLKHSLAADDEIADYRQLVKEGLVQGLDVRPVPTIEEIISDED